MIFFARSADLESQWEDASLWARFAALRWGCPIWRRLWDEGYTRSRGTELVGPDALLEELKPSLFVKGTLGGSWKHIYLFFMKTEFFLTNQLTPWNWVLFQTPSVVQPLNKLPEFYGSLYFSTVLTRGCHSCPSRARWIQLKALYPVSPRSYFIILYHQRLVSLGAGMA
jgi:hypothetical protein